MHQVLPAAISLEVSFDTLKLADSDFGYWNDCDSGKCVQFLCIYFVVSFPFMTSTIC